LFLFCDTSDLVLAAMRVANCAVTHTVDHLASSCVRDPHALGDSRLTDRLFVGSFSADFYLVRIVGQQLALWVAFDVCRNDVDRLPNCFALTNGARREALRQTDISRLRNADVLKL
jgi:hypothetical protein